MTYKEFILYLNIKSLLDKSLINKKILLLYKHNCSKSNKVYLKLSNKKLCPILLIKLEIILLPYE